VFVGQLNYGVWGNFWQRTDFAGKTTAIRNPRANPASTTTCDDYKLGLSGRRGPMRLAV